MNKLAPGCVALIIFIGLESGTAQEGVPPEIESVAQSFYESLSGEVGSDILSWYLDDATLFPPGQLSVQGNRDIRDFWLSNLAGQEASFEATVSECVLKDEFASCLADYLLQLELVETSQDGSEQKVSETVEGKSLTVLKKDGDEWHVLWHMFNAVPVAAED